MSDDAKHTLAILANQCIAWANDLQKGNVSRVIAGLLEVANDVSADFDLPLTEKWTDEQPVVIPQTYLSTSVGLWRVIHQDAPIGADTPHREKAEASAAALNLSISEWIWHGDKAKWSKG